MSVDDVKIIDLYWARSADAIPETSAKYGSYCGRIALNIVGIREDAEECVSDTWFAAWNAMPPHRPSNLAAFLGRITRNMSLDRLKRARAAKRGGGEIVGVLDELSEVVSGKENVEDELYRKELLRDIDTFLRSLPENRRNIFLRRYWYTDGVSDIARRYNISRAAVSSELHRIRTQLRDYLLERGYVI